MKIGTFLAHSLDMENEADLLEQKFKDLIAMGFDNCQLQGWNGANYTVENALKVKALAEQYNVTVTAFWCGAATWGDGPCVWNDYDGPFTIGLVPPLYRDKRLEHLKRGGEFASALGVTDVITHVGFLPDCPKSDSFKSLVACLREGAEYLKSLGCYFLFETGQETPVTLLRTIEAIGLDNLGINLDPANLITYGKGNPVDALSTFGKYVRGVHAKDGNVPTYNETGANETPLGEGMVNYPAFIKKLHEVGYNGSLTIEREISGEQQKIDILRGKEYLKALLKEIVQ
ncbi:MAG: sugar phosphate isomerase/epimerase [Clostridia bacterium]|nr:sugar phosphate isomerase/epimerase [Clostridia bacterium]